MEDISRMASPMSLCEENLFDTNHKVERRKKKLEGLQKLRPARILYVTSKGKSLIFIF